MSLSPPATVALALAAAFGALHPSRLSLGVGLGLVALALVGRQKWLLILAVALVVSGLAQRSLDGLGEVRPGRWVGEVELVSDPAPSYGGVRVDVRTGGHRLEARAEGPAAEALRWRLAGEVVAIRGVVTPVPPEAGWLVPRHIGGRLHLSRVEGWRPGSWPSQVANGLRRRLMAGAESMSPRYRSLYSGLVIGDDRMQSAGLADDFRGAGLTHLLAVSGQNVAFMLALAGPVVRRLRLWPRWFFTLGMIGMFGLVTRFEPSVLRASALAALATLVMTTGHSPARITLLGWATVGLLVIDPLLVQSVGFRLSVAASAAIVVLAPRLLAVLPGPALLREAMAVTVAAQLGVAPVLLATFGPIPVASLPANLLAVPVAGAIMVWGLTAGLLAGLAGPSVAWLLQIPTGAALAWLEGVAHHLARAGLGELGGGHVVALGAGLAVAAVGVGRGPWVRHAGLMVAGGAVLVAVVAGRAPPPLRASVATGVTVWRDGSTALVVLSDAGGGRSVGSAGVLEGLRRSGIDRIGLLVVADSSVPPEVVVDVLQGHPTTGVVTANPGSLGPVGVPVVRPPLGGGMEVGHLALRITTLADRLVVDARPR